MANNCWFEIHVKGRREDCEKWFSLMKGETIDNSFCRIFNVDITDVTDTDDECVMCLCGDCAWSLQSCCRSGYTAIDLFELYTRELHLVMEAYSEEPGIGFMEHYFYDNGDCIEDECVDYTEWFWDRSCYATYKEFCESLGYDGVDGEYPSVPKEDEFDSEGYCYIGGMRWDFSI